MKKIVFIALIGFGFFSCNSGNDYEIGQKTTLEVNNAINAGDVMLGENVKSIITVKNTGSYPLILAEVKGSCSCTIAQYPKDPIPPGKTAEIKAEIETRALGKLTKDVRIIANTEPSLNTVIITANVISK
jgi:hypothetical protein